MRDRASVQCQQAEHRALPGRSQRQRRCAPPGRQRTEDADVHAAIPEFAGQVSSLPPADLQDLGCFFNGAPAGKSSATLFQVAQCPEADPGRRGKLLLGHPPSLAVLLDQRANPGLFPAHKTRFSAWTGCPDRGI
ncbi:MAG TPA: hypothetical protein VFB06_34105 [Streptosporangiaceae bacterium]|nr:hypothetical protein [Streptosporangiaceae bacterium]